MHGQLAHALSKRIVVAGHGACITCRSEIFGGEKAEAARIAPAADGFAVPAGACGLSAVFDHAKVVFCRDRHQPRHVNGPPEQMHWHQGFCCRSNC